jgi:AraC-like DNA-binding protein
VQTSNLQRTRGEATKPAAAFEDRRLVYPPASGSTSSMPRVVRQRFSTAAHATHLQMQAWSDRLSRILDVPVTRSQVTKGFRGEVDTYVTRKLVYLDSRTDPMLQARTAARISCDSMRDYCFHVVVEGIADTETGPAPRRKAMQFMPGVLALDMNQTMWMKRPTSAHVLAFFLPRVMVEAVIPDAESLHGRVVAYTSPLACLLREHLVALCRDMPTLSDARAENALHLAADLILGAFSKDLRASQGVRMAARAAMLGRIKHYIDGHLHCGDLAPEKILGSFPLARATLYRMFENEGGINHYIRNCRLRAAADELVRSRSIAATQIGSRLGFRCASDFTRAFRRAYGVAPGAFRALGLEWLDDQRFAASPGGMQDCL